MFPLACCRCADAGFGDGGGLRVSRLSEVRHTVAGSWARGLRAGNRSTRIGYEETGAAGGVRESCVVEEDTALGGGIMSGGSDGAEGRLPLALALALA